MDAEGGVHGRTVARRSGGGRRRPESVPAGTDYVEAVPTPAAAAEPFEVDPDRLDRATRAHAELQNWLAARLRALGLEPLSPALPADPEFDLAWRREGVLCVCEVKTTSATNLDRQLRLGLGQVLHYAAALRERGEDVRAFLLTPDGPATADRVWPATLTAAGVARVWPGLLGQDDVAARRYLGAT